MHPDALNHKSFTYELPDGNKIDFSGVEMNTFTEGLFSASPPKEGEDVEMTQTNRFPKTITNMIMESINTVDLDVRKEMYANVIVTGGNA
jgi:hypothetical protein